MPMDLTTILRKIEECTESYGNEDIINGKRWLEALSSEPRAFVYHNFLTNEECEHLISIAKPNMVRSKVLDKITRHNVESSSRTSTGTFLSRGHDKIVEEIEKRISDFTFIPKEHGEGLQVIHYEVGQKFEPHHDYFTNELNLKNGGQRIATVLMYLSDVDEGGGTVFPKAKGNEHSKCGKQGLTVLPKKRDALLFWSVRPDASLDPSSLHGGLPVIKGNKWACTKWFRLHEFKTLNFQLHPYHRLSNTSKCSTNKIQSPTMKKTKKQTKVKEVGVETHKKRRTIRCKKCGQGGHNSRTCEKRRAK